MGRPSKLSPQQWEEIERRALIDQEPVNALAKEFLIDESCIRRKLFPHKTERVKPLRELAEKKVQAERLMKEVSQEIEALPFLKREMVNDLARALVNTSSNLATAAELSSQTAAVLAQLANCEVKRISTDPNFDPSKNSEALRGAMILTAGSNEASKIGLNLLAANKDNGKLVDQPAPSGLGAFYGEESEANT